MKIQYETLKNFTPLLTQISLLDTHAFIVQKGNMTPKQSGSFKPSK